MQGAGPSAASVVTPTTPTTQIGHKLTLLRQIGEGGMARIFLAQTRGIGGFEKLVVVKQILPRLAEDAEFIARFFQEAQLAATLDHPNIATVYDVGEDGEAYFYSMEYVRGRDLQKVIRRAQQIGRPLALDEIIAIVSRLCAGLHHAHTHRGPDGQALGIVHRDVSPSNVLLSFEGAVKLADFGVAKARTGMVSTDAGTLRGKLGYMSPEQCRGQAVDRRSDVYAVGVLLWEMLTGKRLHHDENEVAIIHRIARERAPSVRPYRPECSDELERIVARALECEPARRFPSAHALQTELEEHARQLRLSTSARTVATLVHELFDEESSESLPRALTTPASAHAEAMGSHEGTLATVTVAPVLARDARPDEDAAGTVLAEDPLAEDPLDSAPTRQTRRWAGVGLGLGLGVLLGGGGLYVFASNSASNGSRDEVPGAAGRDTSELEPAQEAARALEHREPPILPEVPPSPQGEQTSADPAPVTAPAEPKPSRKRTTKRRKTRPSRTPASSSRELNLDSALPPRSNR
jgi:serine/threonine protein kinase